MFEKVSYMNPVCAHYFADPFVFRHDNMYYAVATEPAPLMDDYSGLVLPMMQSRDMVNWSDVGKVLYRIGPEYGNCYWAPEIAFSNGKFYMYYSVGHYDRNHQMRVAVSRSPVGPYEDVGYPLICPNNCTFAIDPSPFQDDDGQWYLFYARDFVDTEGPYRAGTAIVVDRLLTMTDVSGAFSIVQRATHDWQRYEFDREVHGNRYDWHTLEGAFVRKKNGKYFCLYSGGCWQNETYGVDYAVSDHPMGPYRDGSNGDSPRVMRTVPGTVVGPGHNSIVTGPDGMTDYIAYHAWDKDMTARRLCFDRLDWSDGPRCVGPSWTTQHIDVPRSIIQDLQAAGSGSTQ